MEPIKKTISRKPGARKDRLLITSNRYAFTALFALVVFAGLATYYHYFGKDTHTSFILEFWAFTYGILWLTSFIKRCEFTVLLNGKVKNVDESITFTDSSIKARLGEYATALYQWTSLTSFKESRRFYIYTLAGTEFVLSKRHFTDKELEEIKALFIRKLHMSNKSSLPTDNSSTDATSINPT